MGNHQNAIPDFLTEKLTEQYGEELFRKIVDGYGQQRVLTPLLQCLRRPKPLKR